MDPKNGYGESGGLGGGFPTDGMWMGDMRTMKGVLMSRRSTHMMPLSVGGPDGLTCPPNHSPSRVGRSPSEVIHTLSPVVGVVRVEDLTAHPARLNVHYKDRSGGPVHRSIEYMCMPGRKEHAIIEDCSELLGIDVTQGDYRAECRGPFVGRRANVLISAAEPFEDEFPPGVAPDGGTIMIVILLSGEDVMVCNAVQVVRSRRHNGVLSDLQMMTCAAQSSDNDDQPPDRSS